MADWFFGRITIPNKFLASEELMKMIDKESFDDFTGDEFVTAYSDCQARYGEFENLEDYLVKNKIPFDRYSDSYAEYAECTRIYRPSENDEPEIDISINCANGRTYIFIEDIKRILENSAYDALRILRIEELIRKNDWQGKSLKDYV